MKKRWWVLLFLCFSLEVSAHDFGTSGTVFEIAELDMLLLIQRKLQKMEVDGTLALKQKEMVERSTASVHRPIPVGSVTRTKEAKSWIHDPTYRLSHDLKDQDGVVFYKAGTQVNPLMTLPLVSLLLFIDGDEKEQVEWALEQAKVSTQPSKIILVKGAPLLLMKQQHHRFYFDQEGLLTTTFGIKAFPARVTQKGLVLQVEEVMLPEENAL